MIHWTGECYKENSQIHPSSSSQFHQEAKSYHRQVSSQYEGWWLNSLHSTYLPIDETWNWKHTQSSYTLNTRALARLLKSPCILNTQLLQNLRHLLCCASSQIPLHNFQPLYSRCSRSIYYYQASLVCNSLRALFEVFEVSILKTSCK